jgi:hypothetical protein
LMACVTMDLRIWCVCSTALAAAGSSKERAGQGAQQHSTVSKPGDRQHQ